MLSKYTKEVLVVETKAAKREPEFTFYDAAETKLYAYNVKPAVFDLFLAFAVFMYLGLVYLSVKVRSQTIPVFLSTIFFVPFSKVRCHLPPNLFHLFLLTNVLHQGLPLLMTALYQNRKLKSS